MTARDTPGNYTILTDVIIACRCRLSTGTLHTAVNLTISIGC